MVKITFPIAHVISTDDFFTISTLLYTTFKSIGTTICTTVFWMAPRITTVSWARQQIVLTPFDIVNVPRDWKFTCGTTHHHLWKFHGSIRFQFRIHISFDAFVKGFKKLRPYLRIHNLVEGQKMEKVDLKRETSSSAKVSERHRNRSNRDMRKKREAARATKRRPESAKLTRDEIIHLIRQFNLQEIMSDHPLNQVKLLNEILKNHSIANKMFAPSNMAYEYRDGPFLFENDDIIKRLVQLMTQGMEEASLTLVHISGHEESYTWSMKLMQMGVMHGLQTHLNNQQASPVLRENCFWIVGNLAVDSMEMRDFLINDGIITCLLAQPRTDKQVVLDVSWVFKTLFSCSPAPTFPDVAPMWDWLLECFKALPKQADEPILENILDTVFLMSMDPNYRTWLISSQKAFLMELRSLYNVYVFQIAALLSTLAMEEDAHEFLVTQMGAATLFEACLSNMDPRARLQGALGVCNLGSNNMCLSYVCTPSIVRQIFKLFADADTDIIESSLDHFLLNVVECAAQTKQIEPIQMLCEAGLVRRMARMVVKQTDFSLVVNSIRVTDIIMTILPNSREQFEGHGVLDSIEALLSGKNERLQRLSADFADKWNL